MTVAPSGLVDILLEVLKATSQGAGRPVDGAFADRLPANVSAGAQQIADSLASGQKVAVWLGNQAAQHGRFAELYAIAAEIARVVSGRFGVIGEAANSVGGYLAKAVPADGGLNALQMLESPRKGLIVLGAEPGADFMDAARARNALGQAEVVVFLTAFKSAEMLDVATVMLPVAPFSETSGSFVNTEGRLQSFAAVATPKGQTRPAWKVLRVLGNLLSLPGFEQQDSNMVRAEAVGSGDGIAANLATAVPLSNGPATAPPAWSGSPMCRSMPAIPWSAGRLPCSAPVMPPCRGRGWRRRRQPGWGWKTGWR